MEKSNIAVSSLTIKLSEFEGPLDLLLHLIKKSEMDIFDLPIATITEQYLAFIHHQQDMQLDVASEYLVMAATLVQIKSTDLLPEEEFEDELIVEDFVDPREELMLQLLTYKQFQVASEALKTRQHPEQQSFGRLPMTIPSDAGPETFLAPGLGLVDLQVAFSHLLSKRRRQQPISRRVVSEKYTMADAMNNIKKHFAALQVGDVVNFELLFDGVYEREPLVMTFLALLEMAKSDQILLHQDDTDSEIFLEIEKIGNNE